VAVSLSQLAQVYAGQGKHAEAEPVYLQALKIYQAVHGENHADVAATLNNLGVLHRMYGQYAEAEPLLSRSLAIKERLLGPNHPDVALSVANLGQLYVAQGQPAKAEPLYRRALSIRKWPRPLKIWPTSCASSVAALRRWLWICRHGRSVRSGVEDARYSVVAYLNAE
jgi:tetratricopeptide (TPR) repeat protein